MEASSSCKSCGRQGNRPHPTSLRSATFPKGEGYNCAVRLRWKRQTRAISGERPHHASHAADRGIDLIRPRCARPPSPKGKAAAVQFARLGNGRLCALHGSYLIWRTKHQTGDRPHPTLLRSAPWKRPVPRINREAASSAASSNIKGNGSAAGTVPFMVSWHPCHWARVRLSPPCCAWYSASSRSARAVICACASSTMRSRSAMGSLSGS